MALKIQTDIPLNIFRHFTFLPFVTWSTTERREIRNFPYPSVFELTGHQILTIKRGIRTVGQFFVAEVTNPGQNESQQMFAFCDRMDKKIGGYTEVSIVARRNRLTGWRKEIEAEWLAGNLKTEVAPFSSAEIGKKGIQF